MEGPSQIFHEESFLHFLKRETGRATRYHDFFSVCVLRPEGPDARWHVSDDIKRAVSQKIPEFVRATDMVGRLSSAIGIILLHAAGDDARRVAERIRANIEQVAFRETPEGPPQRFTVSVGKVSFPQDGHDSASLLSKAMAFLDEAAHRGGNQVTDSGVIPD
jgi:diguanylate cyclase (GGDEF)-like protein